MEIAGIVETAAGTAIGGLISWGVSYWYYKRSGDQLAKEARDLQKLTQLALVVLTDPKGNYQLKIDDAGQVVGLIVQMTGRSTGTSASSATSIS